MTTVVPAWFDYVDTIQELDALFTSAIAHAGDANFNAGDWFGNNGSNGDYEVVMAKKKTGDNQPVIVDDLTQFFVVPETGELPIAILAQTLGTGAGHHFVPQEVIKKAFDAKQIPEDVKNYFLTNTIIPDHYHHGNDRWLDVTHIQYNKASGDLLNEYIKFNNNKIDLKQAKEFLLWMETGEFDKANKSFVKFTEKNIVKQLSITTSTWREGFIAGNALLEGLATSGYTFKDPKDAKAFLKIVINGDSADGASVAVKKMLKVTEKKGVKQLIKKGLKKVFPAVSPIFIGIASLQGYKDGGFLGAYLSGTRELVAADLIESTADALVGPVIETIDLNISIFFKNSKKSQYLLKLYEDPMNNNGD